MLQFIMRLLGLNKPQPLSNDTTYRLRVAQRKGKRA